MTIEVNEPVKISRRVKQNNGTYSLAIQTDLRWSSLTTSRDSHTELIIADLTLRDIEKMAYDLLKIIEEERK